MSIPLICPQCGTRGKVRDEKAGDRVRCTSCGAIVDVPAGDPTEVSAGFEGAYATDDALEPQPFPDDAAENATPPPPWAHEEPPPPPPALVPQPASARSTAGEPAGFWRRLAAFLLDNVLLTCASCAVVIPFVILLGVASPDLQSEPAALNAASFALQGVSIILAWLYFAFMESSASGATLGKRVLGIMVTDREGYQITFARATGRYFGKILSGIICYIGFIMAAFTPEKQALHDMIAGTYVVRRGD